MNFSVKNKKLKVMNVEIGGIGNASLFLIGDAEVITGSSIFDTPADSLLYSPKIPVFPPQSEIQEAQKFFKDE